ncbi:hypothetical protein BX600DRAFT_432900 [Xylariales sp. PMI_506]|nr:hypothetical protein BX600DRAFT_432900 [Xylariales sp. PMI_506]
MWWENAAKHRAMLNYIITLSLWQWKYWYLTLVVVIVVCRLYTLNIYLNKLEKLYIGNKSVHNSSTAPHLHLGAIMDRVSDQEDPLLVRRRQRARLAQRAFRQRQVDALEKLEKEVAALRSVIRDISHISSTVGNPELNQAVRRAVEVANIESGQDGHLRPLSPNAGSRTNQRPVSPEWINQFDGPKLLLQSDHYVPQSRISVAGRTFADRKYSRLFSAAEALTNLPQVHVTGDTAEESLEAAYATGRMSPRLTYGLWLEPDSGIQLPSPPSQLLPYLGRGEHTLAGVLFWNTVELGMSLLDGSRCDNSTPQQRDPIRCRALVNIMFGMCFRIESPNSVIKRIRLKLELRKHGRMGRYDHDASARLHALVLRDLAQRGESLHSYLSPLEVVDYIQKGCTRGTLEWLDYLAKARGSQDGMHAMTTFVEALTSRGILFGDGPRFRIEAVQEAFKIILPVLPVR